MPSWETAMPSAPRKMNQNASKPMRPDGLVLGATRCTYWPVVPLWSARSSPTPCRAFVTTVLTTLATIQPMASTTRKPSSLGRNANNESRAPWIESPTSTAARLKDMEALPVVGRRERSGELLAAPIRATPLDSAAPVQVRYRSCTGPPATRIVGAMTGEGRLRIGEFSRRTGLSIELLRAWERRYGVPTPERTESGLRLYGEADLASIEQMRAELAAGLSPAEAARAVRAAGAPAPAPADGGLDASAHRLRAALHAYREADAQSELDQLFGRYGLETVLQRVILPFLRELGDRWACNEATVGQEHFASAIVHGRLVALARGWDTGIGPAAVLAAAPGEPHTLGPLCFAPLLRKQGWRITY